MRRDVVEGTGSRLETRMALRRRAADGEPAGARATLPCTIDKRPEDVPAEISERSGRAKPERL